MYKKDKKKEKAKKTQKGHKKAKNYKFAISFHESDYIIDPPIPPPSSHSFQQVPSYPHVNPS